MRPAHVAKGVDHRQDDEAEGERNASMGDGSAAHVIDDDGAGARKDEGQRADEFREQFSHLFLAGDRNFAHRRDVSDFRRGGRHGPEPRSISREGRRSRSTLSADAKDRRGKRRSRGSSPAGISYSR